MVKEEEFFNKLGVRGEIPMIKIGIFYSLDKNGNVLFNEQSMRDVFNVKLKEIKEILK